MSESKKYSSCYTRDYFFSNNLFFLLNSWNISHFQMILLTVILLDIQLINLNLYINWYITILHLHHSKITLFIARNVWTCFGLVCFMVLNVTFNIISVISWRSVLLVVETVVPGENHRPVANHSQTLSHNVVSSYTSSELDDRHWLLK